MTRTQKLAAAGVAALAIGATGAAVAATRLSSPQEEQRAVVNDAAKELGVTPERLSTALKNAFKNRVDEAVEAGRLTQEEGNRLKRRIDAQEVPLLGPALFGRDRGFGFRTHHRHTLGTAATYLGLSEAELRKALDGGKTLAQVARDRNKSVSGLVDALVADARKHLDAEVDEGEITRAHADRMLQAIREGVTAFVNGERPMFRHGPGFPGFRPDLERFGHRDGMPLPRRTS